MIRPVKDLIRAAAIRLPQISDPSCASAFDIFGTYKIVLLGDACHVNSEFCAARAEMIKRLVELHGFNIIAVEADWPDSEEYSMGTLVRAVLDYLEHVVPKKAKVAKEN